MTKRIIIIAAIAFLSVGCSSSKNLAVASYNDDGVVGIGYGTITKDQNTSASTRVKVRREEGLVYTNMIDYLRGKVAGLSIDGSGNITIRGINSIQSSTSPLFIVDGMEVQSITNIDPNIVESVDVIKDGSAAIYGARGGNGVIIINLRKQ